MNTLDKWIEEYRQKHPEDETPAATEQPVQRTIYCAVCRDAAVPQDGDTCDDCRQAEARGYQILTLAGRCRNGAARDSGTLFHAVPLGTYKALCGAEPGRLSYGWSTWKPDGRAITCRRCAKRAAHVTADR